MKKFDNNHTGNRVSIEVVSNGFVLETSIACSPQKLIYNTFQDLVRGLAFQLGVARASEIITITGSEDSEE